MRHGNEDTIREMLRIRRSVQATYNTQVNFMASQMLKVSGSATGTGEQPLAGPLTAGAAVQAGGPVRLPCPTANSSHTGSSVGSRVSEVLGEGLPAARPPCPLSVRPGAWTERHG